MSETLTADEVAFLIGRALYSVVRAEERESARMEARSELDDLRCIDCGLRYGERSEYRCEYPGKHTDEYPMYGSGHCFEKVEVDAFLAAAEEDTNGRV